MATSKAQRHLRSEQRERLPGRDELLRAVGPLQAGKVDLRTQLYAGVADLLIPTIEQGPQWRDIAHAFQLPPAGEWTVWMLLAGRGCIAPGTLIYDPVAGTHTPVEVLAERGTPMHVQSWTPDGPVAALASAPYHKGTAPLYRFEFADGTSITVTDQHQFLTPDGWQPAARVRVHDLLRRDDARPLTSLGSVPRAWLLNAPGWSQKAPDSTDRYSPGSRRGDGRPPQAGDVVPALLPSRADVRGHNHLWSHGDALVGGSTRSRAYRRFVHRARNGSSLAGPWPAGAESHVQPCALGRLLQSSRSVQPSRGSTAPDRPVHGVDLHRSEPVGQAEVGGPMLTVFATSRQPHAGDDRSSAAIPHTLPPAAPSSCQPDSVQPARRLEVDAPRDLPLVPNHYQIVVSIIPLGVGPYYDLTVPGTQNYLANGVYSHNSGKTRAASEYVTDEIMSGRASIVGLIGPTAGDVRDVMVEGPAGLLKIAEQRGIQCFYQPSKRRVIWPEFGATATLFSAQEPRRLRGPQHDLIWAEEIAAWQDAWQGDSEETTWNNAMFGLRLGQAPKAIITTTPKANKLTRELVKRSKEDDDYVITTGSTYANRKNLAPSFFKDVIRRYEGTRLGRQEIEGQLLEDVEGALWQHEWIDAHRIPRGDWYPLWRAQFNREIKEPAVTPVLPSNLLLPVPGMYPEEVEEPRIAPLPDLVRVVVAVDPNTSSNPTADVAGVIVGARGSDGHGYIFDDRSAVFGPTEWSRAAIDAYHEWLADKIVAERNNGGEMVKITIRQHDEDVPVELVWASRGKVTRAEPVASLYEQGRVHHVGTFNELEDEYVTFVPGAADISPGRLDAAVWCLTELFDLTAEGPDQRSRELVVF